MRTGTAQDEARAAVEARLKTLGLPSGTTPGGFALDATITPETFARSADLGPSDAAQASVGPLPRIALSGEANARAGAVLPSPASADLEILSLLGEGGMGRVHLARQRSLGRDVAIKTLKAEVADARTSAMLRAEATTMGRLEHPNVVPVHAVGLDDDGRLLLVMKRIDGVSWRELLRDPDHPRWASLAPDVSARLDAHLDVLVQVAKALHFAHESGVVHRDVKPDNVLLGAHGEVYLADWGVALRASDRDVPGTELVGTPAYMAPEMVVGDRTHIDRRADVFLLGATLHEVLTGTPPHSGPTLHATLLAAFEAQPPSFGPEIPSELAAIALRAMAPRPDDRFPTALAFRQAIEETRRHRGSIALARQGRGILRELRPLLEREGVGTADASIDRRLTECRFALVQALRDWPENEEARAALDECLHVSIEHELTRENASAAGALLRELSVPDPGLAARIEALTARLEARRAEAERLKRLEADQDIGVGFAARAVTAALLFLVGVVITTLVAQRGDDGDVVTAWDTVVFGMAVLVTVVVPIVLFRGRLLANAIGRRVSALLVLFCVTLVAHRLVGYAWDVVPTAILSMDLTILAGFVAAFGVLVPRVALAAVVPAAAAVWLSLARDDVPLVFSITTLLTMLLVSLAWITTMRGGGRTSGGGEPSR